MVLYDVGAIRAERKELLDEAATITAMASQEERELTPEEESRIAEIFDLAGEDTDDGPTGLLAKLEKAERYDRMMKSRARSAGDGATTGIQPVNDGGFHSHPAEPFKLPRSAISGVSGRLKAFTPNEAISAHPMHDAFAAGRWVQAICGNQEAAGWCEDHGIANVMKENDNESGGFLVPDEMSTRIILLRESRGVFRQFADSEQMMSDHKTVTRHKAGPTAYWVGEGASVTASDESLSQVELNAKSLAALVRISRELDADSAISLADKVAVDMAYAFADKEDRAGFVGDSTSTHGGVAGVVNKANDGSHTGALYTAPAGDIAYSDQILGTYETMAGALPLYAEEGAAWYLSKIAYYASIARLMDAAGGNRIEDLGRGPERVFLGYPVRFVQVMNTATGDQASTAGLAILGNLGLSSILGNRQGMRFQVLLEKYADTREIGLIGDARVAINNHTVTDPNDSTARGPVVVLKTPAS